MRTWEQMEKEKNKAVRNSNWNQVKMITLEQAIILEKEGRDSFELRKAAAKYEIYENKESCDALGCKLEISTLPNACEACKKDHGKIYSYKDALDDMPIPHKDCTHEIGFCRCMWIANLNF